MHIKATLKIVYDHPGLLDPAVERYVRRQLELAVDKLRTGEPCELVKCDVCGCVVHEGCASVIPEDSTWCDNCQNQFDHAVSKD